MRWSRSTERYAREFFLIRFLFPLLTHSIYPCQVSRDMEEFMHFVSEMSLLNVPTTQYVPGLVLKDWYHNFRCYPLLISYRLIFSFSFLLDFLLPLWQLRFTFSLCTSAMSAIAGPRYCSSGRVLACLTFQMLSSTFTAACSAVSPSRTTEVLSSAPCATATAAKSICSM